MVVEGKSRLLYWGMVPVFDFRSVYTHTHTSELSFERVCLCVCVCVCVLTVGD